MLAIIGLSRSTVPFIKAAKKAKIDVLGFDKNPIAYGRELVDRYYQKDAEDYDGILQVVDYHECIGCFTYSSDPVALHTTAKLNARLSFSGMQVKPIEHTIDKGSMKKVLIGKGLPTPEYVVYNEEQELREILNNYGEIVMKPIDGTGGLDIRKFKSSREYYECFEEDPIGTIIEPYLEGPVYSVDGFVSNGKPHLLAVSSKTMVQSKGRFIMRGFETVGIEEGFMKAGLSGSVVEAFRIDNSFYSIDMVSTEDGLQVIDVGLLLDVKMDRLLYHMGIDVYDIGIQLALGMDVKMSEGDLFDPGFTMKFIYPPNSKVLSDIARWDIYDPDGKIIVKENL